MAITVKRIAKQALAADKKARAAADTNKVTHYSRTADSFQNFAAALGMDANALFSGGSYGFNPVTRIRVLLEWIHRGSWLGGMAVDLVADDMTRAGIEIKGELDPEDIEEIQETAVSLGIWNRINESVKWGRLYGGAIGVHLIEGQPFDTPFRIKTVGKDQYRGLYVLDRWMVEPSLNDLVTDMGPYLGLPKYYRVRADAPALRGSSIHYSRCYRILGIELPYWQRIMEMLWGVSILERLYDRMIAFDSATQGAAQLVFKSYLRTYKIENLRELIAAGGQAYNSLVKQINFMSVTQSNEGITLMDTKDEFETFTAQSFSGIETALMALLQQISGCLQIPLTRLLGQSPAGLNSTGESDVRTYYDGINQQQERYLREPVTTTYRCIAQSLGMKVPDGFTIQFRPLWQLSEAEKGTTAGAITDAVTKATESGLISEQVALKELKQSSQITGVFSNIRQEDIDAADDEPQAPEPEMPAGPGAESPRAKKAKDAAQKMTKAETRYTDHGTPERHCAICKYFESPSGCAIVEGEIKPEGVCEEFQTRVADFHRIYAL